MQLLMPLLTKARSSEVERYFYTVEVWGSIPCVPTTSLPSSEAELSDAGLEFDHRATLSRMAIRSPRWVRPPWKLFQTFLTPTGLTKAVDSDLRNRMSSAHPSNGPRIQGTKGMRNPILGASRKSWGRSELIALRKRYLPLPFRSFIASGKE